VICLCPLVMHDLDPAAMDSVAWICASVRYWVRSRVAEGCILATLRCAGSVYGGTLDGVSGGSGLRSDIWSNAVTKL
jgi:hypothetical protein